MSIDLLIEALKAALIGVVEGITEWLMNLFSSR